MLAEQPEVAGARDRLGWRLRRFVFVSRRAARVIENVEQAVEVVLAEAEQTEVEPVFFQPVQFSRKKSVIPGAIDRELVVGDPERARLRIGQMPEPDDRNLVQPEPAGGEQSSVAGDQHPRARRQGTAR